MLVLSFLTLVCIFAWLKVQRRLIVADDAPETLEKVKNVLVPLDLWLDMVRYVRLHGY